MANFIAVWSGEKGPHLCRGEWFIFRDGVNVSALVPDSLRKSPMGTRKEYWEVDYRDEYDPERDVYEWRAVQLPYWDGLSAKKWIRKNRHWIGNICQNMEEKYRLYRAINAVDWRCSSCEYCYR